MRDGRVFNLQTRGGMKTSLMAVAGWLVLGAASGAHGAAPSPVCPDLASLPLAGARIDSAQAVANLMQAHNPDWVPLSVRRTPDMPAHMREMVSRFETPPLGQVVGRDAAAAYRYARLCERICPDPHRADAEAITRALRERLDNAARERAEAEADRLRDQHFPDAGRAEWFDFIRDDTQIPPRG